MPEKIANGPNDACPVGKGRSKNPICLTKKLSQLMRGNTPTATKRKTFAVIETPLVDSPQSAVNWRLQRTEEIYEAGNR
jgi:hypothetical protein